MAICRSHSNHRHLDCDFNVFIGDVMTDDEILELADRYMDGSLNFRSVAIEELLEFARAIAAKERAVCADIVDAEMDIWPMDRLEVNVALNNVAAEIRARGE